MRIRHQTRQLGTRPMLGLACGLALLAVSCGSDDDSSSTVATSGTTAPAADGIEITGAWARTSPAMAEAGAAYMTITSATADRLIGASVDASVAAMTEIHETVMAESMPTDTAMTGDTAMTSDTTMGGGTMAPAMEMRPVDAIDLPAGSPVALAPGGYHIMLLQLAKPLVIGESFTIQLTFETAGTRDVTVVVADEAP